MSPVTVYIDIDLKELVPLFIESRQDDIASLRQALRENNYEALRQLGHTLKGVGGGYGFDFVTEIGASIEQAAKTEDDRHIAELTDQMEESLANLEIVYDE